MTELEEVPNSYGLLFTTSETDGWKTTWKSECYALKFSIPNDATVNVLKDVYIIIGSRVYGSDALQTVGLSRTLTTNTWEWETNPYTWEIVNSNEQKIISNATTKNGSPVRCNPGEVWYVMIILGDDPGPVDWWFSWKFAGPTTPEDYRTYLGCNGWPDFAETEKLCVAVYGYRDEIFYVDYDYTPTKPVINQEVTFTDTSNQNLIESRQWIIEGIPVSTNSILDYTFIEPKVYSVTLVGVSYGGANLQMNKLIDVRTWWACNDYDNQADCIANGCYWWSNNNCYDTPEPVPSPFPWWILAGLVIVGGIGAVALVKKK